MKDGIDELKSEFQARLLFWKNIKSNKIKAILILFCFGVVGLKIFTTVLTFDWLVGLI